MPVLEEAVAWWLSSYSDFSEYFTFWIEDWKSAARKT